jgi:hypothetical protein
MSRAYSRNRAYNILTQGNGATERLIKICILGFPSIWVSCDNRVLNSPLLKEDCYLVLGQSIYADCVIMMS